MALTGYSGLGYQTPWGSLSLDPNVCDGNTATEFASAHSPPNICTAAIDTGASGSISQISFNIKYADNSPTVSLEWSNDHATWSSAGIPALSPPPHGGTYSAWSQTLTGLSLTAQYVRISISDPSGGCAVVELTVPVISAYDCETTTTTLPAEWNSSASFKKLTFALGSPSTGKWWGGTLRLEFNIDVGFTTIDTAHRYYLEACVLRADNATNDGAFFLSSGSGLRFQLVNSTLTYDLEVTLTDQFLDACSASAGGNLVITVYSNWPVSPARHIAITDAELCLRNNAGSTISGSNAGAVPVDQPCDPLCGSNAMTDASGTFSSPNLEGVKYKVISGSPIDMLTLMSGYVNSAASAATYESDGLLRHIDVTIPVPSTAQPFGWLSVKLNLKGTYTPDHDYGQLETTNDYPLYRFLIGCDVHDHGSSFTIDQIAQSDTFDGRYAADFSVDGIELDLCPGSGSVTSAPFGTSMNSNLGHTYRLYIAALHIANDGAGHSGDSLIDWGNFTFTDATFTFTECEPGTAGSYDSTKTADPGPVFSDPSPLPLDSIGGFIAHLNATAVYKKAANPDIVLTYDRWMGPAAPSPTYGAGWHYYHTNTGISDADGHVNQYVGDLYHPPPAGYTLDSFTINSLTEEYCKCLDLDMNSVLLQADTFKGILNALWVSGGPPGKLKHAAHLAPAKHIGSSTVGWEATQEIETTDDVSNCGMVYLPNGRLYINYQYAGDFKQRHNDRFGTGSASDWSASAAADSDHISAAGTGQQQVWRFEVGGAGIPGIIYFAQCRDNRGEEWTTAVEATGNIARGPLCAGAFTGNQYLLLYTRGADGNIFFLSTADPATWSGDGTDTGYAGNVCGFARHPSGRLVGLVQATKGGPCKCLISNDQGSSWTQTAELGISPEIAPVIVSDIAGIIYVVYIESDSPRFVCSVDGGVTFV